MTITENDASIEINRIKSKLKYFLVYIDCNTLRIKWVVRFAPLETDDFPHGIRLALEFDKEIDAHKYAEKCEQYIDKFIAGLKL